MSAASFLLAKNYGQYIVSLESELSNPNLASHQKALLFSNIAVAQFELGLNRKSIKSSQSSIDVIEAIATEFVDSMSVYCILRASVVKGKALLGSGKANEAVAAWSSAVSKAVQFGWNVVVDVSLLMELNNLIEQHRVVSSAGTDKPLSVDVPPTSEPGCKQDADTQPSPAASSPTSPATPTAAAAGQQPTIKKSPVKSDAPTSASLPSPPPTLATTTAATTSETSTTTTKASRAADADAAALLAAKEIYRSAMMAIHRRSIGDGDEHAIKPIYLTAIRANLPHICGEPLVDDLICLSYINVNSGNLETASSIFKLLNEYRNDLPAALIGVGSISAMQRNFDDAIAQFTKALNIDDTIADAWKRRGQTRAAKGLVKTALKDLTKAISLIPGDADCYNQRGLIYHQSRNYTRALADFQAAQTRGLSSATLLNNIGMCEGQLGCVKPSIESHLRAIKLEPLFKEAHLNIALMHKESGDWVNALTAFEGAIKCDTKNPFFQAYGHRGLMYAQLGRPGAALKDLLLAINVLFSIVKSADNGTTAVVHTADERATRRTELVLNLIRAAMCYQQLGQYHKSTGFLDQALSLHPGHTCWFQKEIGLFLWTGVDVELSLYNLDDRTDPRLKDGWCKHSTFDYMVPHRIGANAAATIRPLPPSPPGVPAAPLGTGCYGLQRKPASTPVLYRYSDAIPVDEDGEQIPSAVGAAGVRTASTSTVAGSGSSSAVPKKNRSAYDPQEGTVQSMRDEALKLRLVELTKPMSRWIQLDSPGFLPNRRQHRMFGVAVLQMAAALTRHLSLISLEGIGLLVPDAVSSRASPRSGSKATSQPALTSATAAGSAVQNTPKKAVSSSAAAKLAGGAAKSSTGSSSSSSSSSRGESPSGKRGATRTHTFNWRDLYDIAVRWRQVSEPGDPVWWIDRFPTQAFEDGFGLQTPLVNGHLTTVRYAPYFQPAFDRVKEILQQQGYYTASDQFVSLGPEDRRLVAAARTLTELRAAVGRNFYVVVPCPSLREPPRGSAPALILEGTRLTLLAQEPEGFDFTIRTPGKPHRWAQYEEELAACFHRLEEAFLQVHHRRSCTNPSCSLHPAISTSTSAEATDTNGTTAAGTDAVPSASPAGTEGHSEDEDQLILRPALEMFYLWATFAPLSRGTAACGYASLCAVLLSFGRQVAGAALLPRGKQLDWEAILAVDFEAFWTKVRGWFKLVPASPALMVAVNHPWRVPAGGAGDSADVEVVSDAPSDAPISSGSSSCSSSSGGGEEEGMFECVRTLRDMLDVMNLPYGN